MSDIYDAMRKDLESAMANLSKQRDNDNELRRQHAEIERLTAAWHCQHARKVEERAEAKLWFENTQKVKEMNAELLEALKVALDASWDGPMPDYAREKASAVIAKAEEVKP